MLLAARTAKRAEQMDDKRLQWIFQLFPAVEKFWHHPAGKLSGGQKQMLAVARAIVEPRELLIVDEPSKGLAPAIVNNMIDAFEQLKASGVTHPAGRAEHQLRQAAGRHGGGDGQRRCRPCRRHAGASRRTNRCKPRCWGWRYDDFHDKFVLSQRPAVIWRYIF
jgi:ABC-type lipoprotein export system ATPase subunit